MKNRAVVRRTLDYRKGPGEGSTAKLARSPEVVAITTLRLLRSLHAYFPVPPRGDPGGSPFGHRWRRAWQRPDGAAGRSRAAVQNLQLGARRDQQRVRRRAPRGPSGVRRDRRHAEAARSAFELLRPAQLPAAARASAGHLLRSRYSDSVDRRRHHGHVGVRELAGLQEGSAAQRRDRADQERQPEAGVRQGRVDQAGCGRLVRRQGLDLRSGRDPTQGTEGHDRRHLDQAPRLRRADRSADRARYRQHVDGARRVHDRQGHRLREARRLLRDVERRGRQRAEDRLPRRG